MASSPRPGRSGGGAVRARAWCRVDLAGGTLDIWPLGLLHANARTVNVAVDLPVDVQLTPRDRTYRIRVDDEWVEARALQELIAHREAALAATVLDALDCPPVEVRLSSASPRGGGLGASSAMTVALIAAVHALTGKPRRPPLEVVTLARDLEARLMGLPTGIQDHYPALLGGALEIVHGPGGHRVHRLAVDLERFGASLILVYSGLSHFSAGQNWQVVRRRLEGDDGVAGRLRGISEVAAQMPAALVAGDLPRVGELMLREWGFRRLLAEGISTPTIEELLQAALALGAWGGKACGAGGGGCVAILAPQERKAAVSEALAAAGGTLLPARPIGARLRVSRSRGGESRARLPGEPV